jgi:hypothetical protein
MKEMLILVAREYPGNLRQVAGLVAAPAEA